MKMKKGSGSALKAKRAMVRAAKASTKKRSKR
jgi:hypothetical protein